MDQEEFRQHPSQISTAPPVFQNGYYSWVICWLTISAIESICQFAVHFISYREILQKLTVWLSGGAGEGGMLT
jgi:hypothetical protein